MLLPVAALHHDQRSLRGVALDLERERADERHGGHVGSALRGLGGAEFLPRECAVDLDVGIRAGSGGGITDRGVREHGADGGLVAGGDAQAGGLPCDGAVKRAGVDVGDAEFRGEISGGSALA